MLITSTSDLQPSTAISNQLPGQLVSTQIKTKGVYIQAIATKLMLCFTDYLPSQGDSAGWKKIKIKAHHETICITKITMIAKYLEDTASVHSQLANSTFLSHVMPLFLTTAASQFL